MNWGIESPEVLLYKKEFYGTWWLPNEPEIKIPGKLTFTYKDGLILDLLGNFDHKHALHPLGNIILGESTFGEKITLYQAFIFDFSIPCGDEHKGYSKFHTNRGFIGYHFIKNEDVIFQNIEFYLTNFEDWLNQKILDFSDEEKSVSIKYTFPDSLSYTLDEDLKIRIFYQFEQSDMSVFSINPSILHRAKISIELSEPIHFSQFGEYITHFKNLITLAIMSPIYEYGLIGYLEKWQGKNSPLTKQQPIHILLQQSQIENPHKIYNFHMLFTFEDIQGKFNDLIKNWFKKKEELEPIFDLFFNYYFKQDAIGISQFLNYIQALETYHTRRFEQKIDPEKDHKIRVREILDSCPEEFKEWLGSHLGHWTNEKTLHKKLEDIIDFYPYPVTTMNGDKQTFIKKVKTSRNFYTHYDPSLEEKAITGGYLKGLSMTLGVMLEAILCIEMGLEKDFVIKKQRNRKRLPPFYY